jgi:predicted acyl esterase
MLKRARSFAVLLMLVAAAFAFSPARAADPPGSARETGYVTIPARPDSEEVKLAYTAVFPDDGQPHPTLFEYSGYNPGAVPDIPYIARYVPKGYAFIGVNIRGTGCSSGTFDFFEPRQGEDGAYVIDHFIPTRPWSNGDVAMIGKSFPGITQLFVAEQKPAHLKAIAPGHFYADAYRDVAYPGGILNYAFATLWSFISQPEPGYASAMHHIAGGDQLSRDNVPNHRVTEGPTMA